VCADSLAIDIEKNSLLKENISMQLQIYFYNKYFGARLGVIKNLNL
jgi:hypothetical protein